MLFLTIYLGLNLLCWAFVSTETISLPNEPIWPLTTHARDVWQVFKSFIVDTVTVYLPSWCYCFVFFIRYTLAWTWNYRPRYMMEIHFPSGPLKFYFSISSFIRFLYWYVWWWLKERPKECSIHLKAHCELKYTRVVLDEIRVVYVWKWCFFASSRFVAAWFVRSCGRDNLSSMWRGYGKMWRPTQHQMVSWIFADLCLQRDGRRRSIWGRLHRTVSKVVFFACMYRVHRSTYW
jgi:hypothetical protein